MAETPPNSMKAPNPMAPNGGKQGPLKPGSLDVLRRLAKEDIVRLGVNPGVVHRLTHNVPPLAVIVEKPNPFKTAYATAPFLQITDAGRDELKSRGWPDGRG